MESTQFESVNKYFNSIEEMDRLYVYKILEYNKQDNLLEQYAYNSKKILLIDIKTYTQTKPFSLGIFTNNIFQSKAQVRADDKVKINLITSNVCYYKTNSKLDFLEDPDNFYIFTKNAPYDNNINKVYMLGNENVNFKLSPDKNNPQEYTELQLMPINNLIADNKTELAFEIYTPAYSSSIKFNNVKITTEFSFLLSHLNITYRVIDRSNGNVINVPATSIKPDNTDLYNLILNPIFNNTENLYFNNLNQRLFLSPKHLKDGQWHRSFTGVDVGGGYSEWQDREFHSKKYEDEHTGEPNEFENLMWYIKSRNHGSNDDDAKTRAITTYCFSPVTTQHRYLSKANESRNFSDGNTKTPRFYEFASEWSQEIYHDINFSRKFYQSLYKLAYNPDNSITSGTPDWTAVNVIDLVVPFSWSYIDSGSTYEGDVSSNHWWWGWGTKTGLFNSAEHFFGWNDITLKYIQSQSYYLIYYNATTNNVLYKYNNKASANAMHDKINMTFQLGIGSIDAIPDEIKESTSNDDSQMLKLSNWKYIFMFPWMNPTLTDLQAWQTVWDTQVISKDLLNNLTSLKTKTFNLTVDIPTVYQDDNKYKIEDISEIYVAGVYSDYITMEWTRNDNSVLTINNNLLNALNQNVVSTKIMR